MMTIENGKVSVMSKRDYFEKYCYRNDLCQIARMWDRHLDRTIGANAPMAEKEKEYERWLNSDFDPIEWSASRSRSEMDRIG